MVTISDISSLGVITREVISLDNNLIQLQAPNVVSTITSANSTVINLFGKVKKITVEGVFSGDTSTINVFITEMEAWANLGAQDERTLTPTYGNALSVVCNNFTWEKDHQNNPNHINYVLELIEGSALGLITGA